MRSIKFRCWDIKENKWHTPTEWGEEPADACIGYGKIPGIEFRSNDYFIWQQFTGLLDKNGKEIYEGDMLACDKSKDGFQHISKINFGWSKEDIYGFYWDSGSPVQKVDYIEKRYSIIGNIYENPDLIS